MIKATMGNVLYTLHKRGLLPAEDLFRITTETLPMARHSDRQEHKVDRLHELGFSLVFPDPFGELKEESEVWVTPGAAATCKSIW